MMDATTSSASLQLARTVYMACVCNPSDTPERFGSCTRLLAKISYFHVNLHVASGFLARSFHCLNQTTLQAHEPTLQQREVGCGPAPSSAMVDPYFADRRVTHKLREVPFGPVIDL